MKPLLRILKRIWILNFVRRIFRAYHYYSNLHTKIFKWGLQSNEYTNFTYYLTDASRRYLIDTISVVTQESRTSVEGFIKEIENDEELKKHIKATTDKTELKRFSDREVKYGRRLGWYAMVRIMKPKVVIETGVDKGLGSVVLCSALLRNKNEGQPGSYYGTDINPEAGYLLDGKYAEVGEILYGDSIESLKKFDQDIDLFINDSDHSATYEYNEYLTVKDKLSDNAVILSDNAHLMDKLAVFCAETDRNFLFYKEEPKDHWYPGAGIGFGYNR